LLSAIKAMIHGMNKDHLYSVMVYAVALGKGLALMGSDKAVADTSAANAADISAAKAATDLKSNESAAATTTTTTTTTTTDATEARPSKVAGISTVGGGLTSDPSEGAAILRSLWPVASKEEDRGACSAPLPIVPGRRRGTTGDRGENPATTDEDNDDNHNDHPWLAECRRQMRDFLSSEGIGLSSDTDDASRRNRAGSGIGCCSDGKGTSDGATAAILSATAGAGDANSGGKKIDLVCLGPLTNLAHWLERIPDLGTHRLNSVWILGGNIPVGGLPPSHPPSGAEEVEAEFNFARDPEAVRTVFFHKGLRGTAIYVVPQEVCNRSAFEDSFRPYRQNQPSSEGGPARETIAEECQPPTPSAGSIIEDWLASSPSLSLPQTRSHTPSGPQSSSRNSCEACGSEVSNGSATVSSSLPTWMVKLIRTRTFSVYGDPICIYVRDRVCNSGLNWTADDSSTNLTSSRRRPRIRWKEYSTNTISGGNRTVFTVDAHGRLVLHANSDENANANTTTTAAAAATTPSTTPVEDDNLDGTTIRVAQEVELGAVYLDWLAESLLPIQSS